MNATKIKGSSLLRLGLYCILLLTGCSKQIEFTGDETESMIVLIAAPEADSLVSVRLTYSRFFLSQEPFRTIDGASLQTEVNGQPSGATFMQDSNQTYRSDLALREGDTLTLVVRSPDGKSATAGCRMPVRPAVENLTMESEVLLNPTYYGYGTLFFSQDIDFSLVLDDPAGKSNYYMVQAYVVDSATGERRDCNVSIDDNLLFEGNETEEVFDLGMSVDYSYGEKVLFTDDRIDGQRHTVRGTIINAYGEESANIHVVVSTLSRDTYLYWVTLRAQQETGGEMGLFSEPVQIHTNVQGGIGILGAMSPRVLTLCHISIPERETEDPAKVAKKQ